ncbi:uncharacterized protein N0V89_000725 [Didymosphaeria variabile]|uniref:Monopolin complex subunit Csm1/Pcs1 C-terminal domain-containing protein n=1 Tax=Didymosphaeria variabile TaxID=1932322 RepID=A0A9W8XX54_9PLEO|nr:uncharacterized protein N0V89_000725 [Didymosphaeria variabile]KAJ4360165.1 hypothetical protein N0V89_000725 [Didymosphaeria variabile]
MARHGTAANLSFTVDSASEDESIDELNAFPTPDSNTENKAPTRKPRGKVAQMAKPAVATKAAVKAKTTTRRASGNSVLGAKKQGAAVAKKTGARGGRNALAERPNNNGNETEEVDEFDVEEEPIAPVEHKTTRRGRPATKARAAQEEAELAKEPGPRKRGRKAVEKEHAPKKEAKPKAAAKSRATKHVHAEADATILETQPEHEPELMEFEPSIEIEEVPESMPDPPKPAPRCARQTSRTTRQASAGPRRAGSASDTERDPVLRRKVGDLIQKLEAMSVKYENLKEAATSGRESNFDQLKRKSEQTGKDQDAVIQALKQQIAELQSRTAETAALRKDLAKAEKENARLSVEHQKMNESLTAAYKEKETLSTKLAAARSIAPPETKNVPGSAVKARSAGVVLPGQIEAAKKAVFQDQKVELYSDLTNLLVMSVKKSEEGDDVYDLIQTGRNGTLHFQLSVMTEGDSYNEHEFVYQPLLDEQRDRELIELLPDYLTEEISFPRAQAPKFYTKVVDSMSKKIILEED